MSFLGAKGKLVFLGKGWGKVKKGLLLIDGLYLATFAGT